MQTLEQVKADLHRYQEAILLQSLYVKPDLTPEESESLRSLCQEGLARLEPRPESRNDSMRQSDSIDLPSVAEPDVAPRIERNTPTVAAHVNKATIAGAVHVKKIINEASPEVKLGSLRTPVKTVRDITDAQCFFSPGGTTATYKQTTTVWLKKVSGGQFVASQSSRDSETSEDSEHSLSYTSDVM